jgi:hypothetical protein
LKQTKDQTQALNEVLKELTKMPSEPERELFLNKLGLDPKLALKTGADLQKALEDIRKRIGTFSPQDLKNGNALADSMSNAKDSLTGFATAFGSDLVPDMNILVKGFDRIAQIAKSDDIRTWLEGFVDPLVTLREILDAIKTVGNWISSHTSGSKAPSFPQNPRGLNLLHKQSYNGSGFDPSNVTKASYDTGDSGSGMYSGSSAERTVTKAVFLGTVQGVLAAFCAYSD